MQLHLNIYKKIYNILSFKSKLRYKKICRKFYEYKRESYKCTNVDIDMKKISVTKINWNNERINIHGIGIPLYDENFMIFTTGPIVFSTYGIQKLNTKFNRSNKDRMYIKIPNDPSQNSCIKLFDALKSIDMCVSDNINLSQIMMMNISFIILFEKPI